MDGSSPHMVRLIGTTSRLAAGVGLSRLRSRRGRNVGAAVYDIAGKEVSKDDALKALAKGGVVVVSGNGKPIDPAFLATFREGTLVLVALDLVVEPQPIKGGPPIMISGGVNGFPGAAPAGK